MNLSKITAAVVACMALSQPALAQEKNHSMSHGAMSHGHDVAGIHGDSKKAAKAPFDQQFLDTMSLHHEHGIKMAELVDTRASHDDLKTLAKKMIDEQKQDIQTMQDMKKKWYADKSDAMNMNMPGMKESMKGMQEKMQQLEASKGEAFDRLFLDMMTMHHQHGMQMLDQAKTKAQHPEVKDMAKKMRDSQQEDMKKMAAWKKEWNVTKK